MTSFLHAHPWLLFFGALFVVFILNTVVTWVEHRFFPPRTREPLAGGGAQAPRASLPASADEFMRSWDIGADIDGLDWGPR